MTTQIETGQSPVRGQTGRRLSEAEAMGARNNIEYVTDDQLGAVLRAHSDAVLRSMYIGESPKEKWHQTAVICAFVAMLLHILLFLNLLLGNMTASTFLGPVACCVVLVCASEFWFAAFLLMLFLRWPVETIRWRKSIR